jgi:hypothetical protein
MIDPPPMMVDSDHPRTNMWRKEPASLLHRNVCRVCATFLGAPHLRLRPCLPVLVAVTAGVAAYDSGAGEIGAFLVGLIAGALTLAAGQIAVAAFRLPLIRTAIALVFAMPAAMAGYYAALGLAQLGVPAELWQRAFALIGAIAVGATAWVRLALPIPPDPGAGR